MPKFVLPPESPEKKKQELESAPSIDWMRNVRIPVNEAIISELKAGKRCEILLVGKVNEMNMAMSDDKDDQSHIEIEVASVEAYPMGTKKKPKGGKAKTAMDY